MDDDASLMTPERRAWVYEVANLTAPWRHARAARLEREHPTSVWHLDRAKGLRGRAQRSIQCGTDGLTRNCASCGEVFPRVVRLTCAHWRLCPACRGRRAKRQLARFTVGHDLAVNRLRSRMKARTRGGRWAEVFYTFPVPHISLERDALEVVHAWRRFRRVLAHYLKVRGSQWRDVPFFRSVEVTSSKGGHWHVHVWSILPYIPQWLLAHLWGQSLSSDYRALVARRDVADLGQVHGRDAEALAWLGSSRLLSPVVDVRRAEHAAAELIKYMVKDIEHGALVSPLWYARAYQALEGMRSHESSRKWLAETPFVGGWHPLLGDRKGEPFCNCGECLPESRRLRQHFMRPLSTAPP